MNLSKPLNTYHLQEELEKLLEKVRKIRIEKLEPEMHTKFEEAQALLGEIYLFAEEKVKKTMDDYSFLSRDHVFFDGDHINHSGAV